MRWKLVSESLITLIMTFVMRTLCVRSLVWFHSFYFYSALLFWLDREREGKGTLRTTLPTLDLPLALTSMATHVSIQLQTCTSLKAEFILSFWHHQQRQQTSSQYPRQCPFVLQYGITNEKSHNNRQPTQRRETTGTNTNDETTTMIRHQQCGVEEDLWSTRSIEKPRTRRRDRKQENCRCTNGGGN